jgi:trigger factor
MKTEVTELPESRVRIEASVEPAEVGRALESAARDLGRELRIPGFRKGKVPPQIVLQRVGREAVLEQALRQALPEWYERAVLEAGVSTVGDPKLDVSELPADDEPLALSIEVAVRPKASLGDYRGLEVGRAEPEVPEEAIAAELERLREGFASLNPVDREATDGDFLLVDYRGTVDGEPFDGGEGRDQLIELGSGSLVDGFEAGLRGARAGDERQVTVTFPEDYRAEHLAGKEATFQVSVREVREKRLPELDDEFALEASEFDTLEELRSDIAEKLRAAASSRSDEQFREAAVEAAVENAEVDVPEELAAARAEELFHRFEHQLADRGVDPQAFARIQGKPREQLVADVRPEAERSLRREAVLAAIADAEGIVVSDDDLFEALRGGDESPATEKEARRALDQLRASGRDALVREDIRIRRAAEVVVDEAKPIPLAQAEAREKLWTPEKEREGAGSLWTPGSGAPGPPGRADADR